MTSNYNNNDYKNLVAYYPLRGGEDLVSPTLSVKPGRFRFSRNYECDISGRPRRIDGYERFDGQPKPSDASYWILNFDAGWTEIEVDDTVEGDTSGATGKVLTVAVESGSWAVGDAVGYLILYNVTGTFVNDEPILVSASAVATTSSAASENGADKDTDNAAWAQAAIEAARLDIAAVPGSGSLLGAWQYSGVKYAFRNNAGGTAGAMYKSSAAGWVLCTLGRSVDFTSGGTTEIVAGNTVTGATSGATAVVGRVILTSGTWAGGDAAGRFIFTTQTGTLQSENLNVGAVTNLATIGGNSTANALPLGGRYEFENYNFGGHSNTRRMYACNGVGTAFEWDGTVFVPIITGMTTDTPKHLKCHKGHLFLIFSGGSIQHSSFLDPYEWSAITGAAELAIGDEGVGMAVIPGDVLAIFGRNSTKLLYGTTIDDWDLRTHSNESGAIEWTIQRIGGNVVYLDDRGITTLSATDTYGDFDSNTISTDVQPFLNSMRGLEIASVKVRKKNQYRLFFTDGHVLILTINGDTIVGYTRAYYDDPVACCCSVEDTSGNEELFFGSTDGFVYQMDKGTSFDGGAIESYLKVHANHLKTPTYKKRFRKLTVELDAPNNITLSVSPDYSYGTDESPSGQDLSIAASGGSWDIDAWESFVWDGPSVSTGEARIDGSGLSIGLDFYHTGIYDSPHTIQGVIVHYDVRGLNR